ncbi:MAG: PQQ-binding-like beta-propeller repeat protein [Opitutaceae bacterium]|nr:PQQ-binding-like beta-propeller repeat protein [Opitutaceae bacterium]
MWFPPFARIGLVVVSLVLVSTVPKISAQADGAVRWSFTTGDFVLSSPTMGPDGTLYFGSRDKRVYAIKPGPTQATTSLKWSFLTGDWVDSTPAVGADGTIYVGSWDGKLYALRDNGTQVAKLWEYNTGSFIVSSPAIGADGTLYFGAGDSNLYAVNPNGTLKWTFPTGDWVDSSPVVGPDETLYFGSWDGSLYAVDANGIQKWKITTEGGILGAPALAADGTLYFGSRDRKVYAATAAGTVLWTFLAGDTIEASPVLAADGTLYVGTSGTSEGRLYAIFPDGTERWRFPRANQTALQPILSSAAVRSDGSVVFGSSNNAVIALRADGTELWRAALGDWADSSPLVAADGSIYIGSYDRKLYALASTAAPLATDWPQFKRDVARTGRQLLGARPGASGRLANLSVRSVAGQGSETLIVGLVTAGAGQRRLLVRGVGPTLGQPPYNVPGVVADPFLRQFDSGSAPLAENDDWSASVDTELIAATAVQVGAFPLPNPSKDAALVRDVQAPSGYTHHLTGAKSASGVALVEAYDAGGADGARLTNVSARTRVGVGGEVLISGFVISGGPLTVLIRGAGPTLESSFGVTGVLADPQLRLFRGAQVLAENNDWPAATNAVALASTAQAVGAFPLQVGGKDTAMLVTLPPGAYTAQVSGVGSTTGVALVEVYAVP